MADPTFPFRGTQIMSLTGLLSSMRSTSLPEELSMMRTVLPPQPIAKKELGPHAIELAPLQSNSATSFPASESKIFDSAAINFPSPLQPSASYGPPFSILVTFFQFKASTICMPLVSLLPSGLHWSAFTISPLLILAICPCEVTSKNLIVLSKDPVASMRPSGRQETLKTSSACTTREISFPISASIILALASLEPIARSFPSGLQASDFVPLACSKRTRSAPLLRSKIRGLPCIPPAVSKSTARLFPSGLHATPVTGRSNSKL